MVPEGRRIFPNLTVLENLKIGAYLRKDDLEDEVKPPAVAENRHRIHYSRRSRHLVFLMRRSNISARPRVGRQPRRSSFLVERRSLQLGAYPMPSAI